MIDSLPLFSACDQDMVNWYQKLARKAHLDKEEISGLERNSSMTVKMEKGGGFVMIMD